MQGSINCTISRSGIKFCVSRNDSHQNVLQTNLGNPNLLLKLSSDNRPDQVTKNSATFMTHGSAPIPHAGISIHLPVEQSSSYNHRQQYVPTDQQKRELYNEYKNTQVKERNLHYGQLAPAEETESMYFGDTEQNNTSDDYSSGAEKVTSSDYDGDEEDFVAEEIELAAWGKKCTNLLCILLNKSDEVSLEEEGNEYNQSMEYPFTTHNTESEDFSDGPTSIKWQSSNVAKENNFDVFKGNRILKTQSSKTYTTHLSSREQTNYNLGRSTRTERKNFDRFRHTLPKSNSRDISHEQREKRANHIIPHLALLLPMMNEEDNEAEDLTRKLKRCRGSKSCRRAFCHKLGCYDTNKDSHEAQFPSNYNSEYDETARNDRTRLNNLKSSIQSRHSLSKNTNTYNTDDIPAHLAQFPYKQRTTANQEKSSIFKNNLSQLSIQHKERGTKYGKNTAPLVEDNHHDIHNIYGTTTSESVIQTQLQDCAQRLKQWFNMHTDRCNNKKSLLQNTQQRFAHKYKQQNEPLNHYKELRAKTNYANELPKSHHQTRHRVSYEQSTEKNETNVMKSSMEQDSTHSNTQESSTLGSDIKYAHLLAPDNIIASLESAEQHKIKDNESIESNDSNAADFKVLHYDSRDNTMNNAPLAPNKAEHSQAIGNKIQSYPKAWQMNTNTELNKISRAGKSQKEAIPMTTKDTKLAHTDFESRMYKPELLVSKESNEQHPSNNANKLSPSARHDSNKPTNGAWTSEISNNLKSINLHDIYKNLDHKYEFSAGQWVHIKPVANSQNLQPEKGDADTSKQYSSKEYQGKNISYPKLGHKKSQFMARSDNEEIPIDYKQIENDNETTQTFNKSVNAMDDSSYTKNFDVDGRTYMLETESPKTLHTQVSRTNISQVHPLPAKQITSSNTTDIRHPNLIPSVTEIPVVKVDNEQKDATQERTTATTTITTESQTIMQDNAARSKMHTIPKGEVKGNNFTKSTKQLSPHSGTHNLPSKQKPIYDTWESSESAENEIYVTDTSVSSPVPTTETTFVNEYSFPTLKNHESEVGTGTDEPSHKYATRLEESIAKIYIDNKTSTIEHVSGGQASTPVPHNDSKKPDSLAVKSSWHKPNLRDVNKTESRQHQSSILKYRTTKFASDTKISLPDSHAISYSSTTEGILGILNTMLGEKPKEKLAASVTHSRTLPNIDKTINTEETSLSTLYNRNSIEVLLSSQPDFSSETNLQLSDTKELFGNSSQDNVSDTTNRTSINSLENLPQSTPPQIMHSKEHASDSLDYTGNLLIFDQSTGQVTENIPVTGKLLRLSTPQEIDVPHSHQQHTPIYFLKNAGRIPVKSPTVKTKDELFNEGLQAIAMATGELHSTELVDQITHIDKWPAFILPSTRNIHEEAPKARNALAPKENTFNYPHSKPETLKKTQLPQTSPQNHYNISTLHSNALADQATHLYKRPPFIQPTTPTMPDDVNPNARKAFASKEGTSNKISPNNYTDKNSQDNLQSNYTVKLPSSQRSPHKSSIIISSIYTAPETTTHVNIPSTSAENFTCLYKNLTCEIAEKNVYNKFLGMMLKGIMGHGKNKCSQNFTNSKIIPACDECIKSLIQQNSNHNINGDVYDVAINDSSPQQKNVNSNLTSSEQSAIYSNCKYKTIANLTSLFGTWLKAISNSR